MKKVFYFFVICIISFLYAFSVAACSISDSSVNDNAENINNEETENTDNGDVAFNAWELSDKAYDYDGDGDVDKNDYDLYLSFNDWLNGNDAEDFNGDRKITYADYVIFNDYKDWKTSDKAYDYNGDKKINFDDYVFAHNPENVDYMTWLDSENAYDYDGNGAINESDFTYYNNYKSIIGQFKITNFNCQQYDSYNQGQEIFLNGNYNLRKLANDIVNFDFEITKSLKINCTYSDEVKQKLGEDENAVLSALNSCVFEKYSDFVTTATFKLLGLDFTVYLTNKENGFNCTMNYVIDGVSVNISFDIVYVK